MNTDMMFTRSISGLASTILIVLYANAVRGNNAGMNTSELVNWCASNELYISNACRALSEMGIVSVSVRARGEKVYRLSDSAQQFLPGFMPVLPAKSSSLPAPVKMVTVDGGGEQELEDSRIEKFDSETVPVGNEADAVHSRIEKFDSGMDPARNEEQKPGKIAQKPPESNFRIEKFDSEKGSINQLIDDDDELIKFPQTSSSSSIMNPNLDFSTPGAAQKTEQVVESRVTAVFPESKFPSLEKILAGMDILFGDHLEPSLFAPDLSPKVALAWVCKGYLDARRNPEFKNPVGMIRRRLEKKEPRSLSHLQEMPAEFLEFIGMFEGVCPFCHAGFRTRRELNEHLLTGHTHTEPADEEPDAFEDEEEIEATDPVAQEIWESTKALLQDEMPRASFETWVQGSRGVAVAEKTLRVVARNQFAADWLRERISDDCLVIFGRMGRGIESVSFAVGTAR